MHRLALSAAVAAITAALVSPVPASAVTLYFKNKSTLEARAYEVKEPLIYVTMANGRTVYLRADSVDWEGTEQLKAGHYQLEKVPYEVVDTASDANYAMPGTGGQVLTAADLRKSGAGFKLRRAAAPTIGIEVQANGIWNDSRVNIKAGQTITLRTTGQVSIGPGLESGPEGVGGQTQDLLQAGFPAGALLYRIGLGGDIAMVGRRLQFIAPASGRLYLAVNDRTAQDNSGSFTMYAELPRPSTAQAPSATRNAASAGTAGSAASSSAGSGAPAAAPHRAQGMVGGVDRAREARGAAQSRPTVP